MFSEAIFDLLEELVERISRRMWRLSRRIWAWFMGLRDDGDHDDERSDLAREPIVVSTVERER